MYLVSLLESLSVGLADCESCGDSVFISVPAVGPVACDQCKNK